MMMGQVKTQINFFGNDFGKPGFYPQNDASPKSFPKKLIWVIT